VTVLANTPVGVLRKGDTIWYRRRRNGTIIFEHAVATDRSATTPSLIFARTPPRGTTQGGKARCVPIDQITRIERCSADDATA
jgi:hypothetical protein